MALDRLDAQVEWLAELGLVALTIIGLSLAAIPVIVYWRRVRSERRHRRVSEQKRGGNTQIDLFSRGGSAAGKAARPGSSSRSEGLQINLGPKRGESETDQP